MAINCLPSVLIAEVLSLVLVSSLARSSTIFFRRVSLA